MYRVILTIALLYSFSSSVWAEAAESDFNLAAGHFGVEADIMPGGPEGGTMLPFVTWENDKMILSLGGNYYQLKDNNAGPSNAWQGEARASYRMNVAKNSFVDVGWDYSWQWGTSNGASFGRNYNTGAMIGFSREFAGTNVFFTVFIEPVQYIYANGDVQNAVGWGYFQNGGVGARYLF